MKTLSQCDRVLAVLTDGESHTIQEIHERAGTMRLNSRVAELRKRGHAIECIRENGTYAYRLVSLDERPNRPGGESRGHQGTRVGGRSSSEEGVEINGEKRSAYAEPPDIPIRPSFSLDSSEQEDQTALDRTSGGSLAGGNPIYPPACSDAPSEQLVLEGIAA